MCLIWDQLLKAVWQPIPMAHQTAVWIHQPQMALRAVTDTSDTGATSSISNISSESDSSDSHLPSPPLCSSTWSTDAACHAASSR